MRRRSRKRDVAAQETLLDEEISLEDAVLIIFEIIFVFSETSNESSSKLNIELVCEGNITVLFQKKYIRPKVLSAFQNHSPSTLA